jgi:hypothetical protein
LAGVCGFADITRGADGIIGTVAYLLLILLAQL